MHDSLGQELTAVALMLRALAAERAAQEPQFGACVQPMIDIVTGMIRSTRAMAAGIFARPATELGLTTALEQLAQAAGRRSRVPVECRIDVPLGMQLESERADHLYHIAQEAITNALRHAGAQRIVVELGLDAGGLRLVVSDDGRGVPPLREHPGLGLRIMQYRAHAAGGELRIEAQQPRGTRVEFRASPLAGPIVH
jgi:signal transduction histidine kinase